MPKPLSDSVSSPLTASVTCGKGSLKAFRRGGDYDHVIQIPIVSVDEQDVVRSV